MRLPTLTAPVGVWNAQVPGLGVDRLHLVVPSDRDWWACARCALKVPGCYAVCDADPSGVLCAACIDSGGDDCVACFR
jgi:hypothetical protein